MSPAQLIAEYWRPAVEIGVFWAAFYLLFLYIKDSGMMQAVKGIIFLAVFFLIAQTLQLDTIRWILSRLFEISVLGFLILFQPELRRGLTRIGQNPVFKLFVKEEKIIHDITRAAVGLAERKIGALIAIEREVSLKPFAEGGIHLDAAVSSELLTAIFLPQAPFHDGGAILQGNRIIAVGCLFPLSQNTTKLPKSMGTRHRAALGLSEEADALVIAVSEETGSITIFSNGKVRTPVSEDELLQALTEVFQPLPEERKRRRILFGRRSS
ncbi:MAG: Cyclic di-AMP synthase CdaA [Candidatus Omnitrophica bacterium]|nr:Cyclic di-AMP synthase CdaA [Candidatus Omnitrophota bacterium]